MRMCDLHSYERRDGFLWTWGVVRGRDGTDFTVVTAQAQQRENLESLLLADAMVRAWRPANLLVVDIGGGVKGRDEIALGDVVVHTHLHYYDFHKVEGAREIPRYTPLPGASMYLRELARGPGIRRDASWLDDIEAKRPDNGRPKLLHGEMLSGGALLSRGPRLDQLLEHHDKALVVEMDGAGPGKAVLGSGLRIRQPEFLVVRAVSDFCNDGQGINQETRERWRAYAAEAAAAFARAIIREADGARAVGAVVPTPPSLAPQTPRHEPQTPQPPAEPSRFLPWRGPRKKPHHDVRGPFELNLTIGSHEHRIADLKWLVLERRRLVLLGRAGAGKTFAAQRTLEACEHELQCVFVGERGWARDLGEKLLTVPFMGAGGDWERAMDVLLQGATGDFTVEQLRDAAGKGRVLVVVDGINLAQADVATRILDVLNQALRNLPSLAVLVTDRSRARYARGGRWVVAEIAEVERRVALSRIDRRYGEGTWSRMPMRARTLLESPFFLDLVLRGADYKSYTRSQALADFVHRQVELGRAAVAEVVAATADAYERGVRRLRRSDLSKETAAALEDAGLVAPHDDPDLLMFKHDLYADYFASLHLVEESDGWRAGDLDAISFSSERWRFEGLSAETENFDAITLAAEQMPGPEVGDRYLRAVYDWNWRAAVDSLMTTDPESGPFSAAARIAVLALLSERRADPVDGTRKRAVRLLAGLVDPVAQELAKRPESASRRIVRACGVQSPWFDAWRELFVRDAQAPWSSAEVDAICSPDTLVGWTASYVLKRAPLNDVVCNRLQGIYKGGCGIRGRASVRWRVVHSLGVGGGADVLDLLLDALDHDEYHWVRWGAGRSIAEYAARAEREDETARAIDALRARAAMLPEGVASEIAWVAQYHGAQPHFLPLIRPLLIALRSHANGEIAEQWVDRVKGFDAFWDARREPPSARR